MRYTEDYIKKVLANVNIVNVIKQNTTVYKYDGVYTAKCPFHDDAKESMIIDADRQVFHCLDCGKGGNAAVFLMELKGMNMARAVGYLAKIAGITPTENDIEKKTNDVLKSNLRSVYKDAAIFYRRKLASEEGKEALEYLKNRKLTDATIAKFGLGYAPGKGNTLYKYLHKKGYTDDLLLQAGLIKLSETGPYDMFRNRVIFPIMDEKSRVIAFGGRVLDDEAKPKYLNSPESPIFNKSNTLYGIHDLKDATRDFFILVEGNMDVIQLHQAGIKNSVATLGTAFTPTHIPVIKKYTDKLVLSYDGDQAGQKAAMRTIKAVDGSDIGIRILSMNPCKDPDDFIKLYGVDEYKERINRSMDQTNFQLKFMASQYDITDPAQKQEFLERAVEAIVKSQGREVEISIERN